MSIPFDAIVRAYRLLNGLAIGRRDAIAMAREIGSNAEFTALLVYRYRVLNSRPRAFQALIEAMERLPVYVNNDDRSIPAKLDAGGDNEYWKQLAYAQWLLAGNEANNLVSADLVHRAMADVGLRGAGRQWDFLPERSSE